MSSSEQSLTQQGLDITDNEKYLNKDLLYDVEQFDDDDKISVIVTLSSDGLADSYNKNNKGYSTLSDYANSRLVNNAVKKMLWDLGVPREMLMFDDFGG